MCEILNNILISKFQYFNDITKSICNQVSHNLTVTWFSISFTFTDFFLFFGFGWLWNLCHFFAYHWLTIFDLLFFFFQLLTVSIMGVCLFGNKWGCLWGRFGYWLTLFIFFLWKGLRIRHFYLACWNIFIRFLLFISLLVVHVCLLDIIISNLLWLLFFM